MTRLRLKASPMAIVMFFMVSALLFKNTIQDIGPIVESRLFPVYENWSVGELERTRTTFCWTIHFDKLRAVYAEEINYHLADSNGNSETFIPYVTDGFGLNKADALKVGPNQRSKRCVRLPDWVDEKETITITGRFKFKGYRGLWQTTWDVGVISHP